MKFWNGEAFEGLYDENGQQSKGEYTYLSGNCYDGSFKHKERYNVGYIFALFCVCTCL